MTDNRTTELEIITEALTALASAISWTVPNSTPTVEHYLKDAWAAIDKLKEGVAATLGSDDEYEAKMDALLCRLTNGKWSKSRSYDLDFMVSCVDEEFEDLYAKELADATLGNGTLTAEQVREAIERNFVKVAVLDDGKPVEWRDDWVCKVGVDYRAIADELNARAKRTCRNVAEDDSRGEFVCSECGHVDGAYEYGPEVGEHCKGCGARVVG